VTRADERRTLVLLVDESDSGVELFEAMLEAAARCA